MTILGYLTYDDFLSLKLAFQQKSKSKSKSTPESPYKMIPGHVAPIHLSGMLANPPYKQSLIIDSKCHYSVSGWLRTAPQKPYKHMVTIQAEGNPLTDCH